MIFYAADAWRAPPPWSGVRAPGRQEEKKGTKNPGSALLARVTLDTWPTVVGQPCADPTAIAARLRCVWLTVGESLRKSPSELFLRWRTRPHRSTCLSLRAQALLLTSMSSSILLTRLSWVPRFWIGPNTLRWAPSQHALLCRITGWWLTSCCGTSVESLLLTSLHLTIMTRLLPTLSPPRGHAG